MKMVLLSPFLKPSMLLQKVVNLVDTEKQKGLQSFDLQAFVCFDLKICSP